jgi:ferric-dicitrate binding protein FerR (iron transport regulator)
MKEIQDGHLEFVSRHFDASALSTRKAWRSVRKRVSAPRYTIGYIVAACAVTAAIVAGVFLFSSDSFNRPGHRLSGDFHADSLEDAVSIIETALDVKLTVL